MESLRKYLNNLPVSEQDDFAKRCETTRLYLRTAINTPKKLGGNICINIERESGGAVTCESIRPDIDWQYLRGTNKIK